jgi:hypothetical protein
MSLEVDAQHAYSQDLRIVLRGPSGAQAVLANHGGGGRPYAPHTYAWDDVRGALHVFGGTSAQGDWSLDVRDDAGEDQGVLRSFTLHFTCGEAPVAVAPPVISPSLAPRTPRTPRPPRPTPPGVLDPWSSRPPPPVTTVQPTPLRNGGAAGRVLTPTY